MSKKERDGIYYDLPFEDYLNDSALGSSDLKVLAQSPESYFYGKKEESSKAYSFGRAFHALILEGEKVMLEGFKFRTAPRSKEFTGNPDGEILSSTEKELLYNLKGRFESHPKLKLITDLIKQGRAKTEVSYFWEEEGIRFKCRWDILIDNRIIFDPKTIARKTGSYDFNVMMNSDVANFEYQVQNKHYINGLKDHRKKLGLSNKGEENAPVFQFIFFEKPSPNRLSPLTLEDELLEIAQYLWINPAIANYEKCLKSGNWKDEVHDHAYAEEMPSWFRFKYLGTEGSSKRKEETELMDKC